MAPLEMMLDLFIAVSAPGQINSRSACEEKPTSTVLPSSAEAAEPAQRCFATLYGRARFR
jgi:hypothetical protein